MCFIGWVNVIILEVNSEQANALWSKQMLTIMDGVKRRNWGGEAQTHSRTSLFRSNPRSCIVIRHAANHRKSSQIIACMVSPLPANPRCIIVHATEPVRYETSLASACSGANKHCLQHAWTKRANKASKVQYHHSFCCKAQYEDKEIVQRRELG
jgi:hypothetical protein